RCCSGSTRDSRATRSGGCSTSPRCCSRCSRSWPPCAGPTATPTRATAACGPRSSPPPPATASTCWPSPSPSSSAAPSSEAADVPSPRPRGEGAPKGRMRGSLSLRPLVRLRPLLRVVHLHHAEPLPARRLHHPPALHEPDPLRAQLLQSLGL